MLTSDFMLQLAKSLQDTRQITESSANQYLQTLFKLNGDKPFKNLGFLKQTDTIQERINTYAPSTQTNQYTVITSVLTPLKDKPAYKKAFAYYAERMNEGNKEKREREGSGIKSDKQNENWLEWDDVVKKLNELREQCASLSSARTISATQYDACLNYLILALYTMIQPRRNQDYLDMYVVKKLSKDASPDKNYLDLTNNQFVFNKYKTAKTYGQQILPIPNELMSVITLFLKHHPIRKTNPKLNMYKLLVKYDGTPITIVNAITRVLNKIFGKQIGSSMLRHIYLTNKYEDDTLERKKDSEAMGHSLSQQKEYIKPLD